MCLIRDVFKGLCGSRLCQSTLSDSRYWANLEVEVYFDSAHTPRVVMQHERKRHVSPTQYRSRQAENTGLQVAKQEQSEKLAAGAAWAASAADTAGA